MKGKKKTLKALVTGIVIFILLTSFASAQVLKELTFKWEQPDANQYLKEWHLYWSDTETGTFLPVIDGVGNRIIIPYDGTPAPNYTATQPFSIIAEPGQTVVKYFVIIAVDTDGDESGFSDVALNEDGTTGVLFKNPRSTPVTFTVIVKIITE